MLVADLIGPTPDDDWLSSVYPEAAIALVRDVAPAESRLAAQRVLPLTEAALARSTSDPLRTIRLRQRVAVLQSLAR